MSPLLITALSSLLPLAIKWAEGAIQGQGQGANKMATVLDIIRAVVGKLAGIYDPNAQGAVGKQPTDETLQALIEAEFQRLKAQGALVPAPAPQELPLFLLRGSVTPIQLVK